MSQVLEICDYSLSIMAPWHSSDMQATITSDPDIHANYVGKYGAIQLSYHEEKEEEITTKY